MSLKVERFHVLIHGRVQGVGFRYATRQKALSLGLTGWVRNRPQGEVEVAAQGPAPAVSAFLQWLHQGPPSARVTRVESVADPPEEPTSTFEIRQDD